MLMNRSYNLSRKVLMAVFVLFAVFFSSFWVRNAYAADIVSEVINPQNPDEFEVINPQNPDEGEIQNGCYRLTVTANGKTTKSNSLCFENVNNTNGNTNKKHVKVTPGKGPTDPITLSDGTKVYLEIIGRNDTSQEIDEYARNSNDLTMLPDTAPGVEAFIKLVNPDGTSNNWQSLGWTDLNNFENIDERRESFGNFANLIKTKSFSAYASILDPAGVDVEDSTGEQVTEDNEAAEDDATKKCVDARGAESLGWVVCPILTWMGNAATKVYDEYVQPSLEVKPEIFNGGDQSVRQAWEIFRNIANVAFIILFLVVIFSQVTGVGINNYGIKKLLPKMIIVAVLINLSYIICLILVDVSNILGNGLQAIFSSFSMQLGNGDGTMEVTAIEDSLFVIEAQPVKTITLGSVLVGVGLFGAIVTMIGLIWTHPEILLSILVAGLGIVVAIFFLFILLAARKAAIIVLTVISPVAMACYMLPNTKKFFNKWASFFEGLLLVYPITGFLVSAGDFVSRLLLPEAEDFFTWFTAMIVGIVPIFFIPVVIKGAFSAMGRVGGMLAGMGSTARSRVTGAAKGTDTYRRLMNAGKERGIRKGLEKRSGLTIDRNGNVRERNNIRNKLSKTRAGRIVGLDVATGKARGEYAKIQSDRMRALNNMNANIAVDSMQNLKTELENQRIKAEVAVELGPKPVLDKNNMRTRMQNEYNEIRAGNKVDAIPIDQKTYEDKLAAQQSIEREKMFGDNFSRMPMSVVNSELSNAFNEGDADKVSAAMKNIISRGGAGQALSTMQGADWSKLDEAGQNRVAKSMGETNLDAFKAFSDYRQTGGSAGFGNWSTGSFSSDEAMKDGSKDGIRNGSYLQHIMDGGSNAMINMQGAEIEFASKNAGEMKSARITQAGNDAVAKAIKESEASGITVDVDSIRAEAENNASQAFDDGFGTRIKNAAIYSTDSTAKKAASDVIMEGDYSAQNLGFDKAEDFVMLDDETAKAVNIGMNNYIEKVRDRHDKIDQEIAYRQAIAHEYSSRIAADPVAGTKIHAGASELLKSWAPPKTDDSGRTITDSGIVLSNAQDSVLYGGDTSDVRPDAVEKAILLEGAPKDSSSKPSIILPGGNSK